MGIGKLSNHWKVNGTPIYAPSVGLKILHTSISSADSGRTEDGYMHNTWVRTNLVKINFVWKALTGVEVKHLVNLMQGVAEIDYAYQYTGQYASEGGLYLDVTCSAVEK